MMPGMKLSASLFAMSAAFLAGCQTCYDARFYSDMIGHSTEEIVAWLGLPTSIRCEYGVDEYTWCAEEKMQTTEGLEKPVRIFTDEEGLRHVHYFCAAAKDADHSKHPRITVRFYNGKAVGFYTENAKGLCNRFVPEYLQDAYRHHDKAGHPHLRSQDEEE